MTKWVLQYYGLFVNERWMKVIVRIDVKLAVQFDVKGVKV